MYLVVHVSFARGAERLECRSPIDLTRTKLRNSVVVPCNQCLACRINRRDKLVTRTLLEHHANFIGQFWTLTFSDEGLSAFTVGDERKLLKNFLAALRMRERRKGNRLPIRCFGVLEYGADWGRPHYHILLWNHLNTTLEAEPYIEGLPRIRHHLKLWPHGHVDACPLTVSSCRYVSKYVTKFNDLEQTSESIAFHPNAPALGSLGLTKHMTAISRSPRKQWVQEPFIEIDGKRWALDQTMLGQWLYHCRRLGLKHEHPTTDFEKQMSRIKRDHERSEKTWTKILTERRTDAERDRIYAYTHGEYQRKQDYLLSRALAASYRAA